MKNDDVTQVRAWLAHDGQAHPLARTFSGTQARLILHVCDMADEAVLLREDCDALRKARDELAHKLDRICEILVKVAAPR